MQAYSMDLRERALLDSDAGMKAADVAVKYRVSGSWVRLLKQRRRETGEVAPRVQRHGRRRMLEPHLHTLAALIAEQPDRTLAELKDALVAGHPRPRLLLRLAQAGDPRPHLGGDRRSRRRHPALARALEDVGGTDSPHLTTHRRGPGAAAGAPRPRQPARLPPRRHPRPPLAHGVAHRLPGRWGADPLPPRLPAHRRPQPDPRQRSRAGRHAPDRPQEPRHLRLLQHYWVYPGFPKTFGLMQ